MLNKNYLLLGAAILTLAACSANEETIDVEKPQGAQVDLKTGQIYNQYGDIDPFGVAQSLSSSSVEIYSLDAPAADIRAGQPAPQRAYPRSALESSSVEIYPEFQPNLPAVSPYAASSMTHGVAPLQPVYRDNQGGYPVSAASLPHHTDINAAGEPLARIYFDQQSSQIMEQDIGVITGITQHFKPGQGQIISVEGFANDASSGADATGRKEENLKISMQRAYAVARALMYSGVPSDAIRTVAHGEDGPGATENYSADVSSIARRVDIFITNGR